MPTPKPFNWSSQFTKSRSEFTRLLKLAKPMNQSDLAALLGCTQPHISDIEAGKKEPSATLIRALCYARALAARGIDPRQRVLPD